MPKRRARLRIAVAASGGLALLVTVWVAQPIPRLVWNISASAPDGPYWVAPGARIERGDMVVARVPVRFRALAAVRGYIPSGVPLVKQVAAGAGDQLCALDDTLYLNGTWLATRRRRDGAGRPLPSWEGCVRLGVGQYFLLMPGRAASFDGRYLGVTDRADILGKAQLLWAR